MSNFRVIKSSRFEQDISDILGPDRWAPIISGLEWTLRRSAELGMRVRGTNLQVWPVYPGDGYVYIAYYSISGDEVRLISLIKRRAPVAPQLFDLEED